MTLTATISPATIAQHDTEIINFLHWFLFNIDPDDTYPSKKYVLVKFDIIAGLETLLKAKYHPSPEGQLTLDALRLYQDKLMDLPDDVAFYSESGDKLLEVFYYNQAKSICADLINNHPKRRLYV